MLKKLYASDMNDKSKMHVCFPPKQFKNSYTKIKPKSDGNNTIER